jgi:hypothetical protein
MTANNDDPRFHEHMNHYCSCSPPWRRRLVRPGTLVLGNRRGARRGSCAKRPVDSWADRILRCVVSTAGAEQPALAVLGERVMARNGAAFLVQPEPPAGALRPKVLHLHFQGRADPGEGVGHSLLCGILQCRRSGRAGRPPVKAMGERLSYGVRPRLCFFWHMSRLGGSELSQALRPTDLGMCYFQESLRLSSVALV